MNKPAATPSSSHLESSKQAVIVSAKRLGSNAAVVNRDLVFLLDKHDSVLSKSTALQKLIADAMHVTQSHELRVVWVKGNVDLAPNPATGAYFTSSA
jgi:hypothetical protein